MPFAYKEDEKKKYSYADYLTWPEDERWEIIEGVPYDMSPAPNVEHQDISMNLGSLINFYLKGKPCKVYAAPFDVRLATVSDGNDAIFTVVQPDLAVICDKSKLDKQGCIGAPDLVIEILSKSTAFKDESKKLRLYEQHGIKEYWIINPEAQYVMIYRHNGVDFDKPDYYKKNETITSNVLAGLLVDLKEVFAE